MTHGLNNHPRSPEEKRRLRNALRVLAVALVVLGFVAAIFHALV